MLCALLHIWLYKCSVDWGGESFFEEKMLSSCGFKSQSDYTDGVETRRSISLGLVSPLYQLTIVSLCILTLFVHTCNPYFKIQIFTVLCCSLSLGPTSDLSSIRETADFTENYLFIQNVTTKFFVQCTAEIRYILFIYALHLHMGDISHHRFLQLTQIVYSNLLLWSSILHCGLNESRLETP